MIIMLTMLTIEYVKMLKLTTWQHIDNIIEQRYSRSRWLFYCILLTVI